jgi:hypothetical protein
VGPSLGLFVSRKHPRVRARRRTRLHPGAGFRDRRRPLASRHCRSFIRHDGTGAAGDRRRSAVGHRRR